MHTTRLLPFALLSMAACSMAETPQHQATRMAAEAAAARTAIEAADKQWMAHLAAGHADSVAAMYATNARMMGAGSPTAVGRDAIRAEFGQMMQIGSWNITLHTDSVWANGPIVVETGTWTSSFKPGANAPPIDTADHGKYMVRWTQENGRWLLADDIYNSDKMPGPPPAPAKRR